MSERWFGAALYLPPSRTGPLEWLASVGSRLNAGSDVKQFGNDLFLSIEWGGLCSEARCVDASRHRVLVVRFLLSQFLDLMESSEDGPPGLPLVTELVRSCDALEPDLGLIITELSPDLDSYVRELDDLVVTGELKRILWTRPGAVYLPSSNRPEQLWDHPFPVLETRTGAIAITGLPEEYWL